MKPLLLSLFLLPKFLSAQTYVPFISTTDSSDTWLDVNSCTNFSCFDTYTNRYTLQGDTTIGVYNYVKIYKKTKHVHGADQSQWCSPYVDYYEYYFGSMRESNKRIYVIPDIFNPVEYLAYDFNLTVGDTLPYPDGNLLSNSNSAVVSQIDSVLVFGAYRKRFITSNNKQIVEGIGASTGLFNPIVYNTSSCGMQMLCYAEYGTPDYFLEDCNLNLGIDAISGDQVHPTLVKVVDFMGRETQPSPNTPLIYMYSDGSVKKVVQTVP